MPHTARKTHVVLTSHPGQIRKPGVAIDWGMKDPMKRGPVIASTTNLDHRNAIGSHSGSYTVYRALATAAGALNSEHRPDLTNTSPVEPIGPYNGWFESIPGKMSGAWVLKNTRMPVATIFESLERGASLDNIMDWYDGLARDQVKAVIEFTAPRRARSTRSPAYEATRGIPTAHPCGQRHRPHDGRRRSRRSRRARQPRRPPTTTGRPTVSTTRRRARGVSESDASVATRSPGEKPRTRAAAPTFATRPTSMPPDPVTGLVAGGCNMVVFTTGRGSCFGCKPTPTIKVATNTPLYNRMRDDMDLNAGSILDGNTIENVGTEIFEKIVAVASGDKTLSEQQGIGDEEFCPWMPGPVF